MAWRVRISAKLNSESGKYGYAAWVRRDKQEAINLEEPVPWANAPQGALLQGLLDVFRNNIPAGENVVIENVYDNKILRRIVMEGHSQEKSKLYKEASQLLNQYACRVASPMGIESRSTGLLWREDITAREDVEKPLLEKMSILEHERDEVYELLFSIKQENEFLKQQQEVSRRDRWTMTEDELPDLFSRWGDQAEALLKDKWESNWGTANPFRDMLLEPILIRMLIQKGDPIGRESFAWPAFLLSRGYEIMWNRRVLDPLARFLLGKAEIRNIVNLDRKLGIMRLLLVDRRHFSAPAISISLNFTKENNCSLRDVQFILWDEVDYRVEPRPIEFQEAVHEWVNRAEGQWMWDRNVQVEMDWVRKEFRNPVAHGDIFVSEANYLRLEDILLTGDDPRLMRLVELKP